MATSFEPIAIKVTALPSLLMPFPFAFFCRFQSQLSSEHSPEVRDSSTKSPTASRCQDYRIKTKFTKPH